MELLAQIFSYVCGQLHLCMVSGEALPICERCTGLYVGGVYALMLLAVFRPRVSNLMLWVHGLCMLVMVPFGYHMIEHGSVLRIITGQVFAYGLTYFLLLLPASGEWKEGGAAKAVGYWFMIVAGIPLFLVVIRYGGHATAVLIACVALFGLVTYALLVSANLAIIADFLVRKFAGRTRRLTT